MYGCLGKSGGLKCKGKEDVGEKGGFWLEVVVDVADGGWLLISVGFGVWVGMVLKGICGGVEGLVPSAIIQENVPRLIGKVIVNVRVRVDLNMTLILSLDHMHPFLTLIVDLSQHFSTLFAKQKPIIMDDLKIFLPAAAGLERERVRLN